MRTCENRATAYRHHPLAGKILGDGLLHNELGAGHFHRRQELTIWKLRKSLHLTAYADEVLHVVVPRSNVLITDRPVDADALAQIRLKVQVAPTVSLPSPDNGASAYLPPANPEKRLSLIGGVR